MKIFSFFSFLEVKFSLYSNRHVFVMNVALTCFHREIRKLLRGYPILSGAMNKCLELRGLN